MRRSERDTCQVAGCSLRPWRGWLCETHHEQDRVRRQREGDAVCALHKALIDGRLADEPSLRDELFRVREWWFKACDVVQSSRERDDMPADEAEYALEWCISAAQGIIDDERALRSGRQPDSMSIHRRAWVWKRIGFLARGLCSNGLPRLSVSTARRTRS